MPAHQRNGARQPCQSQKVVMDQWGVSQKENRAWPIEFLKWIPAHPPSRARVVIPVAVVNQVRLIILIFGREPEGVALAQLAGHAHRLTEGAVFVTDGLGAVGGVEERHDIPVAIERNEVGRRLRVDSRGSLLYSTPTSSPWVLSLSQSSNP